MEPRFRSFVILGAMRTGSNFLEASLNEIAGLTSHGEVFNPDFIGRRGATRLFGIDLPAREADPLALLERMRARSEGLAGFRFFQGHDMRVFDAVLADPACAKIVLSRDPLDSFLSLGIATETDQWMLRDAASRRSARIRFDGAAFAAYLARLEAFYAEIRRRLQIAGQTAFPIRYPDLSDVEVLNGLAAWLGVPGRLERPSARLKRQNPGALAEKVENPEDILPAIARLDLLDRASEPALEPARRPAVSSYVAAPRAPLLFLPVAGGPVAVVEGWLAALDGAGAEALLRDFTRKTLRGWRAERPGHRSFTVIRHPLARAHEVFRTRILAGPEGLRARLGTLHGLDLPRPGEGTDTARHRGAFLGFLRFVRANLAGQTSLRVAPAWAGQEALVQGFAGFHPPDAVLREERLAEGLVHVAAEAGRESPPLPANAGGRDSLLEEICGADLEAACREAYGRDYAAFGYGDWAPLRRP